MRVLHVIAVMGAGGAETMVEVMVDDAVARGDQAALASSGGFRADALAARGVPTETLALLGRSPADLARSVLRLRRFVRAQRPDLVHVHNVKAALVARAAVPRRIPILVTLHGVPEHEYAAAGKILRRAADHVVAVSTHVADSLAAAGVPRDRITVIDNAMVPMPQRDRAEARRRLGIAEDTLVVSCIARMAAQKRHDLLVEAWPTLPGDPLLLVAGDGPTRPDVERAVAASPASRRIRLLGERDDVDWLLAATDVLVLPTDWEGLPISLLEAMSLGVPVVVSRVGGVADNLADGVHLVEPHSADALAEGLARLLSDDAYRLEVGKHGRDLVAQRYDPAVMLGRYREVYDRLLGSRSPRRSS